MRLWLLLAVLACASCKTAPEAIPKDPVSVVDAGMRPCDVSAVAAGVPVLAARITGALRTPGEGWRTTLPELVTLDSPSSICAWQVVWSEIQAGVSLQDIPGPSVDDLEVQTRATLFETQLEGEGLVVPW